LGKRYRISFPYGFATTAAIAAIATTVAKAAVLARA